MTSLLPIIMLLHNWNKNETNKFIHWLIDLLTTAKIDQEMKMKKVSLLSTITITTIDRFVDQSSLCVWPKLSLCPHCLKDHSSATMRLTRTKFIICMLLCMGSWSICCLSVLVVFRLMFLRYFCQKCVIYPFHQQANFAQYYFSRVWFVHYSTNILLLRPSLTRAVSSYKLPLFTPPSFCFLNVSFKLWALTLFQL